MRKFCLISAVVMSAALVVGCGDDDAADIDVLVLPIDAAVPQPDAPLPRGDIEDFEDCVADNDCTNPNSDCRQVGWYTSVVKQCMPKCEITTDCPFSTYCYPEGGISGIPGTVLMGDHCWFSFCGQGVGNGTTGGTCMMGADGDIPVGEQIEGYCLSIDDNYLGQCLEAGDVAAGGVCDFSVQSRAGNNCDATSLCIGSSGALTGTCAAVCDPAGILTGATNPCTTTGETCQDSSDVITYSNGDVARQTIAFCNSVTACTLLGTNTCPNSDTGEAQGCAPTNPLRPTGICDPSGTGGKAADATCPAPTTSTPDADQCTAGTLCNGATGSMTCQTMCTEPPGPVCTISGTQNSCPTDMACQDDGTGTLRCVLGAGVPGPTVDCSTVGTGLTCKNLLWEDGFDNTINTPDDVKTLDWGTCQP